jgi:hypothetical protein
MIIPGKTQPYGRKDKNLVLNFEILLSSSYRVPVLYFTAKDSSGSPITDASTIFRDLVPAELQSQVADVGVIGGISMTVNCRMHCPTYFSQASIDMSPRTTPSLASRRSSCIHATLQMR